MILPTYIRDWRHWRWRSVVSALTPGHQDLTLRELLKLLVVFRNRGIDQPLQPLHLQRLIALVQSDLARSSHDQRRHGGPDVPRSMGAWRARYNHLGRYLRPGRAFPDRASPDADIAARLSAAENEGWPPASTGARADPPYGTPLIRVVGRDAGREAVSVW